MKTGELLLRTIHAAEKARAEGFFATADALDEIANRISESLNANSSLENYNTRAVRLEDAQITN